MPFVPIALDRYVQKHVAANPGTDPAELRDRLRSMLADFRTGARCECGQPIWVIGSAEVGHACFSCITGEATPEEDYELTEALGHRRTTTLRKRGS